ncbi:protoporphyrinogen oxidase [Alicyclobacillus hesperidum]|uniref:Coproporphyrinogen III oxidase n=1 Tax=Alicyclobacillus hesperidum TaxID=89784 RepID=A0A1H2Y7W4_9BACL|nr:protoporphyrinogen oxidase [Alicyclobacillus hesperidum]
MTAALRLRQWSESTKQSENPMDIQCMVCEQSEKFGGKIRTLKSNRLVIETGPDSIFTRNPAAIEFMQELGLSDDIVQISSSCGTLVWHDNKLQPLPQGFNTGVPSDLLSLASTELLSTAGKCRALEDLFTPGKLSEQDVSLGEFLRKRLGDELVEVLAAPLLAGIHAGSIDNMSLDANMPVLRQWYMKHRSLIIGALQHRHQSSVEEQSPRPTFISLRGGLIQLIESLVARLQDNTDLRLVTQATSIDRTEDGKYKIFLDNNGHKFSVKADAIILTTPTYIAAELLNRLNPLPETFTQIRYVSTATITFVYSSTSVPSELAMNGFLIPRVEGCTITACTIVSNKWPHTSTEDQVLIRCYVGRDGCQEAVFWSDEDLILAAREDLRRILAITQNPSDIVLKRWNHAMPQYDVGHKERIDKIYHDLQKYPGLFVAGAAYRGVGIPDCISDAGHTVERLKEYFGQRR